MLQLIRILGDGTTIARRNLIKVMRVPEILVAVLVTPLMMVMLFAYVFSGSIDIPGGSYREFLIGGAFALTLTFGATFTGAGLAEDMQNGMIDRFRSLPMSRAAVVVGRTASDMLANVLSLGVMTVAGAPGGVEDPQRLFAEWNPVSAVTQAARELLGNIPPGTPEPSVWPLQHPVPYTLAWVVIIIAVFAPLAVRRSQHAR